MEIRKPKHVKNLNEAGKKKFAELVTELEKAKSKKQVITAFEKYSKPKIENNKVVRTLTAQTLMYALVTATNARVPFGNTSAKTLRNIAKE